MSQEPVDLSPLAPFRSPERWEQAVASVVDRAAGALEAAREETVVSLLLHWRRWALAVAALLVLTFAPIGLLSRPSEARQVGVATGSTELMLSWAHGEITASWLLFGAAEGREDE